MPIGKAPPILLLADASQDSLAVPSKHLLHFPSPFYGKGKPDSRRLQPADILVMVQQRKGAGIINHIITVPTLVPYREYIPKPVFQIRYPLFPVTGNSVLMYALGAYHQGLVTIEGRFPFCTVQTAQFLKIQFHWKGKLLQGQTAHPPQRLIGIGIKLVIPLNRRRPYPFFF